MDDDAPDDDLDARLRQVDPDRWIASRFVSDPAARGDMVALLAFDNELARAPQVSSNPLIGEIRLTWWREVLDEIFDGRAVRRHPTAVALAELIAGRGLAREDLEPLIDARYRELDPTPMTADEAIEWARETGGRVAQTAVRLLDRLADSSAARDAGAAWALGKRLGHTPALRPVFVATLRAARAGVRRLSPQAFPAAAYATLAGRADASELGRRLRVTWAVMRGRI